MEDYEKIMWNVILKSTLKECFMRAKEAEVLWIMKNMWYVLPVVIPMRLSESRDNVL